MRPSRRRLRRPDISIYEALPEIAGNVLEIPLAPDRKQLGKWIEARHPTAVWSCLLPLAETDPVLTVVELASIIRTGALSRAGVPIESGVWRLRLRLLPILRR
jgi:hypothetical protein